MARNFYLNTIFLILLATLAWTGTLAAQPQRPGELPAALDEIALTESAPAGALNSVIGSLDAVVGNVAVVNRQTRHGHWAQKGDPLYEDDVLVTLKDSRCRLTLTGKNVIAMASNSTIAIAAHKAVRSSGEKCSSIEVLKGKVLFFVYRLFGFQKIDFQITTPKMVAAVRGTKFGVAVLPTDDALAGEIDALALEPRWLAQLKTADLEEALTNNLIEITHCEEGRVEVNGQMVAAGTLYDRSSDQVTPLSSAYIRAFSAAIGSATAAATGPPAADNAGGSVSGTLSDTRSSATATLSDSGDGEETGSSVGAGDASSGSAGSDAADSSPAASQPSADGNDLPGGDTDTGGQIEAKVPENDPEPAPAPEPDQEPAPAPEPDQEPTPAPEPDQEPAPDPEPDSPPDQTPSAPTSALGYYCAMITDKDDNTLQHALITTDRVDFDDPHVEATGLVNDLLWMQLDGSQDRLNPYVIGFNLPIGNSGDLGSSVCVSFQQLGGNDHLQWGYWSMVDPIDINGENIAIDNRAYYIFGEPTPDATLQGMTGSAAYTGEAAGTYWTAGSGTDMTGTFVCDVDFDSAQVSTFNMSVAGGGKSALILGASGSLNGGQFELGGGHWQLAGQPTEAQHAQGSLYGPNAEHMGGAWQMRNGDQAATGVFSGDKQ
jgi:hypothetical protein